MKYQAVIFDLDGVICHTDHYHYQAWKQVAEELHISFDEEINNRLRGVSRMESFEIILEQYDKPMDTQKKLYYTEKKNEIYKGLLNQMSRFDLSLEVQETLDERKKRGLKLAIGSSSKNAGFILGQLGLSDYFDAVSDGNHITRSKPDPEVFLLAARLLGEAPKDCLVVEDARAGLMAARAGLMAARAGGMTAAGIGEAAGSDLADYHLSSFRELLKACN